MPLDPPSSDAASTRRALLCGIGVTGLAGVLTACGSGDDGTGSADSPKPGEGASTGPGESAAGAGTALGAAADVPVGGGKIFKAEKVVVTQPAKGEFEAFSAVCTHRGCLVDSISNGTIVCPCHGSEYRVTDGTVAAGPAPKALPRRPITVQNGTIKLA